MMNTTRNSVPQRGCAVGYLRTFSTVERLLVLQRVDGHVLGAVVLEDAPDLRRAADEQQVAHEDGDPDETLDEVLDEGLVRATERSARGRALRQEQRQQHEQAEGEPDGDDERERDGAAAHCHALAGRGERAGAHQPAGADDERLVQHTTPRKNGARAKRLRWRTLLSGSWAPKI